VQKLRRDRLAGLTAALVLLPGVAGCGSSVPPSDAELTVFVSAPVSGPDAAEGRAVVAGAERALADTGDEAAGAPVRIEVVDVSAEGAPWSAVGAGANARKAVRDSTSIAYLGELESGATETSLPITNDAEILQIAPGSPATDLVAPFEGSDEVPRETQPTGVRTFGRVTAGADPEQRGYRAAAVALDAIERADDPLSRGSVIEAFFALGEHESVAGRYTVDEVGEIEFE
jgi:hypothetical protein